VVIAMTYIYSVYVVLVVVLLLWQQQCCSFVIGGGVHSSNNRGRKLSPLSSRHSSHIATSQHRSNTCVQSGLYLDVITAHSKLEHARMHAARGGAIDLTSAQQLVSSHGQSSLQKLSSLFRNNRWPMVPSYEQSKSVAKRVKEDIARSIFDLRKHVNSYALDTVLLSYTSLIINPLFKWMRISSIIGCVLAGSMLGPHGFNVFANKQFVEKLGDLGIILFVFETAMELSWDKLFSMRRILLGIGLNQLIITTLATALLANKLGPNLGILPSIIIGLGFAISSSAVVVELLKPKSIDGEVEDGFKTVHGHAAHGLVLFHDLMTIPLLVLVDIAATKGASCGRFCYPLLLAACKVAFFTISFCLLGRSILTPLLSFAGSYWNQYASREAVTSTILSTIFSMSFITKGIGLPDTLGAFIAGLFLSNSYSAASSSPSASRLQQQQFHTKHQIESDVALFRGVLMNVLFLSIGLHINSVYVVNNLGRVLQMLVGLLLGKTAIIALLARVNGLSWRSSLHLGLLTNQCSEFAFISFGIAGLYSHIQH
jgi:CPA2 family monovalent cation:H+ antiporter-2